MDASAQQENAKAQRTPQAYIYYWKNYWDDKRKGRVPSLTLHRNSSRMAEVRSGDTVWALTRKPAVSRKPSDDTYLIVGHYPVSTVGETPESDPGRIARRWFLKSDQIGPMGLTPFDTDNQNNAEGVIRNLGFKAEASRLVFSLQSHGVWPIREEASKRLAHHVGFQYLSASDADDTLFDPEDVNDAREKIMRAIKVRRGQKDFRDKLLAVYAGRCAITGCDVKHVLEAAHVTPYLGPETNHVTNGLLLRTDLHTLLDCGLLAVHPATRELILAPALLASADYKHLDGQRLRDPDPTAAAPSTKALEALLKSSCLAR